MHYKHAHYVLVEQLGLGQDNGPDWALRNLFVDSTDEEAKIFNKKPSETPFGLTSILLGSNDPNTIPDPNRIRCSRSV